MPPTCRESARQFRALDPEGRAAFVADLLALEGWEVRREGCRLVAQTDDHRRVVHVGSPPTDAAIDEVTVRIRVADTDRYRIVRRTNFSGSELTSRDVILDRFADGTAEYRRIDLDGDTGYERRPLSTVRGGTGTVADWSRLLVARYLNITERRVEVSLRGSGIRYRVISTGEAHGLDHETRDYRAIAVAEPDGWISALRVTYVHPRTGARVAVTAGFDRGPVAVDAPGWYDGLTADGDGDP